MKVVCQGSVKFVNKKEFVKEQAGVKEDVTYYKNTIKDNGSGQLISFNSDEAVYQEDDILQLEGELEFKEYKGKMYMSIDKPVVKKMVLSFV